MREPSRTSRPFPPPREDVNVTVKVEGGNNDHLFSLGQPLTSDQPSSASVGTDLPDVSSLKPAEHLSNGDTYVVTGSVSVASIEQLQQAGTDYPAWVTDTYLDLPRSLPRRVRFKAQEVTRSADTPYDATAAIEQYLRTFPNDYNVPAAPAGQDSVDYFLFDAQRGYFDYHASAMAVMLRSLGIPARIATGYVIEPAARDGDGNVFKLTQRQAFAWPEVYFPGIGWVEFNPTPSQPLINRPGAVKPTPVAGSPKDPLDDAGVELGLVPPGPATGLPAATTSQDDGVPMWPFVAIAVVLAAGLVLAAAAKFAWEFGLGGLPRTAQLWEKTVRLATLGKSRPLAYETPREFADPPPPRRPRRGRRRLHRRNVRTHALRPEAAIRRGVRAPRSRVVLGSQRPHPSRPSPQTPPPPIANRPPRNVGASLGAPARGDECRRRLASCGDEDELAQPSPAVRLRRMPADAPSFVH